MFYYISKYLFRLIFFFALKVIVINKNNEVLNGGMVIASNHLSNWDPVIIGVFLRRRLSFMAKEELFSNKLFGKIIRIHGAFPVKRGKADVQALKQSLRILKNQEALCLFPEGTRSKTGELGEFQQGVAMIALKSGAKIQPVALRGTENAFKKFRPEITIVIGEVFDPKNVGKKDEKGLPETLTENLREKIAQLYSEQRIV